MRKNAKYPFGYIDLEKETPFAEGGHKRAYIFPGNDDLCILVAKDIHFNFIVKLKKKYRPKSITHELFRTVWNPYQFTKKKQPQFLDDLIPVYGLCKTSQGIGVITKLIKDDDGQISKSVKQLKNEINPTKFIDFIKRLRDGGFYLLDCNPSNILVQRQKDGDKFYIVEACQTPYPPILFPFIKKRTQKRADEMYPEILEFATRLEKPNQ